MIKCLSELPENNGPVKLAVIGDRTLSHPNIIGDFISYCIDKYDVRYIVSGGIRKDMKGVDTAAEKFADRNEIAKIIYPPQFLRYEYAWQAFYARNQQIANASTICLAIKNVMSGGTLDCVKRHLAQNKPVLWAIPEEMSIQWLQSL